MTNRTKELQGWQMPELRYELQYQRYKGVSTWGTGICGHHARGSGFCEACLAAEIDRREHGEIEA